MACHWNWGERRWFCKFAFVPHLHLFISLTDRDPLFADDMHNSSAQVILQYLRLVDAICGSNLYESASKEDTAHVVNTPAFGSFVLEPLADACSVKAGVASQLFTRTSLGFGVLLIYTLFECAFLPYYHHLFKCINEKVTFRSSFSLSFVCSIGWLSDHKFQWLPLNIRPSDNICGYIETTRPPLLQVSSRTRFPSDALL